MEGSIKSDFGLARSVSGGTLTPRRYQGCFVLHTIEKVTYASQRAPVGGTLLSTRWRGSLEVCSSTTTEEPHAAIVQPLLVRLPDGGVLSDHRRHRAQRQSACLPSHHGADDVVLERTVHTAHNPIAGANRSIHSNLPSAALLTTTAP